MHSKTLVASLLLGIAGAANFDVEVGKGGLTYTPSTITAQKDDTVTFRFEGMHDVVQSAFATPCQPSAGGLFSTLQKSGTYTVTIQNATAPIWFYCSVPNHCQSGMVGVINPPTGKTQTDYANAAKMASGSSAPNGNQPVGGTLSTGSGSGSSGGSSSASGSSGTSTATGTSGSSGSSSTGSAGSSTSTGAAAGRVVPAALALAAGALAVF